jgi:adenylosuccinate lyase
VDSPRTSNTINALVFLIFVTCFFPYPFLPSFQGVKAGGDRQELHEAIRVHSMDAGAVVKGEGKPNDLLERIAKDPLFAAVHSKLDQLIDPILFVGRAPEQTDEFLAEEVEPILKANKDLLTQQSVDSVNV